MPGRKKRPVIAENFSVNLDQIRLFLKPEGRRVFGKLLNRLTGEIIPLLCQYPQAGRDLLQRPLCSLEARQLAVKLNGLLGSGEEIREFVVDDYLVLYLIRKKEVAFLSVKHHRQLSYDFQKFWRPLPEAS